MRCGEDSEHVFGTKLGPNSVLNLQKLNTDSSLLTRCGKDSEHFFGTRMGPKSVLNLQKLNTDSFVFDKMWRGFRTCFNTHGNKTCSESSEF